MKTGHRGHPLCPGQDLSKTPPRNGYRLRDDPDHAVTVHAIDCRTVHGAIVIVSADGMSDDPCNVDFFDLQRWCEKSTWRGEFMSLVQTLVLRGALGN